MNLHLNKRPARLTGVHWVKSQSPQHSMGTSVTRLQPLASSTFFLPSVAPDSLAIQHENCGPRLMPASPPLCPVHTLLLPGLHEVFLFTLESVQDHFVSLIFPGDSFLHPP